jgi:hypothetical protein
VNELASRLRAHPDGDYSLAVAGAALGIGSAIAYTRMQNSWAEFPNLLLLAVPSAILFALALAPRSGGERVGTRPDGGLAPWQTLFFLFAIGLLAASLVQLIQVLGKDAPGSGTYTWIFILSGLAAADVSVRLDSPGVTLLAAIFFGAAGLFAVNWIDDQAQVATYRDVLLLEGILFILVARAVWSSRGEHANQLVALGGVGLIAGAVLGNSASALAGLPFFADTFTSHGEDGWKLVLIVATIGILVFAAWRHHGGSAFVGLLGFYFFYLFTFGAGTLEGWPLILALVTVVSFAWALVVRPSRQRPSEGSIPQTSQPQPESPPT